MTEETKEYAFEKLSGFRPKIGYPAQWRDFSTVEIDASDLMGNVRQLREYFQDDAIERLSMPTDRDEWFRYTGNESDV